MAGFLAALDKLQVDQCGLVPSDFRLIPNDLWAGCSVLHAVGNLPGADNLVQVLAQPAFWLFGIVMSLVLGSLSEEFGWRGFELDPLQSKWSALVSSLILAISCTLFFFSVAAGVPVGEWMWSPGTLMFYISWALPAINSWCWTMVFFFIGMRFLDFTNKRLQYSREASYPFFFFHQPVIIFIAFNIVGWQVGLPIKMMVVTLGSFVLIVGIYELILRQLNPVRTLFGMRRKKN